MCGIAGIIGGRASGRRALGPMLSALSRRGPDGSGVVEFDDCSLGAVRLAVMDPPGGDQPMVDDRHRRAVAFNGEVYGYRRIRNRLGSYPFASDCDTEVLLALYDRHGATFVNDLPGMFAYALWDEERRELHCGRDRFGEKPLYWTRGPAGEFAFASEVKALLSVPWFQATIDDDSLAFFLAFGHVDAGSSIYRGVSVLPPGHRLTFADGDVAVHRYWHPPEPDATIERTTAVRELRQRLTDAVARQLVADVPVGAFLSGGVDSSTIVALAADAHAQLHTFSLGFGGEDDETPYAREQASFSGTVHHSHIIRDIDVVSTLHELARVYDEPFADSSAVPTYHLSAHAREHVTVALTGDGADELLGGYLFWSRHHLRSAGVRLPKVLGGPGPSRWRSRRKMAESYPTFRRHLDDNHLHRLGLGAAPLERLPTGLAGGGVSDLVRYDLTAYLAGDILVKTDRASMAHGLELRSPFLDADVADFCLALPDHCLVDETTEKLVLREAFSDRWAPSIRERSKQGFGAPMSDWLTRPDVRQLIADLFRPGSRIQDLIDLAGADAVLARQDQWTWNLLVLALWAEHQPGRRQ